MNTIVYGSTIERAFKKLDEIVETINPSRIVEIKKSRDYYEVRIQNGDIFRAMLGGKGARGYRYDMAYIDDAIEQNILDNIILPSCLCTYPDCIKYFYLPQSKVCKEQLSSYIKNHKEQINDLICNVVCYQSNNCPIDYISCEECWKIAYKALLES